MEGGYLDRIDRCNCCGSTPMRSAGQGKIASSGQSSQDSSDIIGADILVWQDIGRPTLS